MFDPVDPRQSFPDLERGILTYWKEEDMFRRSIESRRDGEAFNFYDGPPFATGLPHYGHLLAGTIKDVIPRYQTMRGKRVERRFGWDCHGLPIENIIEKEHDIKSKKDIEAMGIARFNDLCRGSVQRYVKEWRNTVERMGRWGDMDWDYRTMDPDFMESIWWVFQSLHEKGLIYEGHKPMHVCPRCQTPLSNFEVTQAYKDIQDYSVYVKLELEDEPGTFLLIWTTTAWTLPGNVLAAVHPDISYVKVESSGEKYILAKELIESVFTNMEYKLLEEVSAKKLVGKKYKPLFLYFVKQLKEKGFRVVFSDLVTVDAGTGIVHEAPAFGEDDFYLGQREGMPLIQHVGIDGLFKEEVTDFAGKHAKPKDDHQSGDKMVAAWLKDQGKLFKAETFNHSYPHCWRCDSPLLNYATSSWFVSVEKIKQDMLQANADTEWVPAHLRDGRFGRWLEGARDWAISRNRYWGTPLPIWRSSEKTSMDVLSGRDELMKHCQIRFTKVTAVRHGEAEHNVGHFYQSIAPGVDLTAKGKKQAKAAGEYLSSQNVSVIYCSPLNRTKQTADAIAKATGATVIVDERLREVGVGDYERKAIDASDLTLMKLRRQQKLQDNSPESVYHLQGMERWEAIQKRVDAFLDEVLPKHRSQHVIVVTHADPINSMRHYFTREDPFKLSHRPFPVFATPESFFWDHDRKAQVDLHMEHIDTVVWPGIAGKKSVDLTIVRHGETDWNVKQIMQGNKKDVPLNDNGRKQALDTAKRLRAEDYDVVISSDLDRCIETADIIAKELGVKVEDRWPVLQERKLGDWIGKNASEFRKKHGLPDYAHPALSTVHPDGGESFSEFIGRAVAAYEMLLEKYAGKRVLLIGHGGFIRVFEGFVRNMSYEEMIKSHPKNTEVIRLEINPLMKRIPEVLDCWFESGSMPYAQQHYPFEAGHDRGGIPPGFPADFIAEGIDQTRGWFYTLTVLSAALYKLPAFRHCIVNGTVLAEDGRKMSKRLKNYPEPTAVADKHGADAVRFALMSSPAVRGEDLRFSEKTVEETLRNVLLPLWNSYSFFVSYATMAKFEPVAKARTSSHPLDRWMRAEVQDLTNRMTEQLDAYDLSATCGELYETIDALTNWYIRLSRRRFAGKGLTGDAAEAEPENFEEDRHLALNTLYDVLLSVNQLLAPFCPFITDAIYLNLVPEEHGSIHLTDWPLTRKLTKEEQDLLHKNRLLRRIVSLGLKVRSDHTIKIRQPLQKATVAFPPSLLGKIQFTDEEIDLLRQELNVKEVSFVDDPGSLGEKIVMVDARKVGPRLGGRVQEIIQAGKRGEFEEQKDGSLLILDETLAPDEATIIYRGREGQNIAAEKGVVVSLDMTMSDALQTEGKARDVIRAIQRLRKENGYDMGEKITIALDSSADDILILHRAFIEQETCSTIGAVEGLKHAVDIGDGHTLTVTLNPKSPTP